MKDWIWYHWIVKRNYQHKQLTVIYWIDQRGKTSLQAYYLVSASITRFKKCRKRWQ